MKSFLTATILFVIFDFMAETGLISPWIGIPGFAVFIISFYFIIKRVKREMVAENSKAIRHSCRKRKKSSVSRKNRRKER